MVTAIYSITLQNYAHNKVNFEHLFKQPVLLVDSFNFLQLFHDKLTFLVLMPSHIYLEGFPALIIQFSHLFCDPCRNVRDGHMDDILQEDGKVLQLNRQVERGGLGHNKNNY